MSKKNSKFSNQVSEFSQFLVHDLRSPLQIITSLSDLLLNPAFKDVYKGEEREIKIKLLKDSLVNFNGTLTSLLDFANYNLSESNDYDIIEIINSKLKIFNIDSQIELDKAILSGFSNSMSKALDELIINAIEANTSEIKPILKVYLKDDNYYIEIYNEGSLSDSDLRRMHKPFVSNKEERNGLGISYARQVIKNHGGSLNHNNKNKKVLTEIILPFSID